jgi:periplasmic mercuric ion binding protein
MKYLLATVLTGLLFTTTAVFAAEQQTKIEVSELTCPSCPYIAAEAISSIDSVQIVDGAYDAETQTATFVVSYDDAVTTPKAIADATDEYGYPGRVLESQASDS